MQWYIVTAIYVNRERVILEVLNIAYADTSSTNSSRRKSVKTELTIFKLIQEHPSISRVELAREARLSTAAITAIVSSLCDRNLLVEGETPSGRVGRRRIGLRLRSELGYVVGVDLGTYNLRIAITDLSGVPLAKRTVPTQMWLGRPAVLERCFSLVRKLIAEAGVQTASVRGIGFAFSGVIDVAAGKPLSPHPRPSSDGKSWRNVPLQRIVEEEFNVPLRPRGQLCAPSQSWSAPRVQEFCIRTSFTSTSASASAHRSCHQRQSLSGMQRKCRRIRPRHHG